MEYRFIKVLLIYANEHGCSYDEALSFAKTGVKLGRPKDNG